MRHHYIYNTGVHESLVGGRKVAVGKGIIEAEDNPGRLASGFPGIGDNLFESAPGSAFPVGILYFVNKGIHGFLQH